MYEAEPLSRANKIEVKRYRELEKELRREEREYKPLGRAKNYQD